MESLQWLKDLFTTTDSVAHIALLYAVVIAAGVYLGKIKLGGISLGVTFVYTPEGLPKGLCKARKLYYVTTAGGCHVPWDYGFGYIKALAEGYYGIPEIELIQAAGLDLDGANAEEILMEALKRI